MPKTERYIICFLVRLVPCLQCFDTAGWVSGRASGLQKNWVLRCWHHYLSEERCKCFAYGSADAIATPSLWLH